MQTKNKPTLALLVAWACAGTLSVGATTLTFSELPTQPVNGLSYDGVTFHFTMGGLASTDATYNKGDGGNEIYVQDPSLEGNAAGMLTLDFATPTSGLQFGVARLTSLTLTNGLQVNLYDGALNSLGTFSLTTTRLVSFSEGLFTSGLTIGRAELTFPSSATAPRFAIDNLTFTPVPEPASFALLGLGTVTLLIARRRK